ncbi:MAG: nitroreductase family protein [Candidatus Bathyarchaeia archaeon]
MDFFEAVEGRRSIRAFRGDPVDDGVLRRVLEAAQWAPSAGNLQAREFIVVRDPKVKGDLARAALGQWFMAEAPVNIVVCANLERSASRYGDRGRRFYAWMDAAAAVENLILAAHALGLASCWIGAYRDEEVAEVLGLPGWIKPVAIIPLGYPGERAHPTPRMSVEKLTFRDRYGQRWRPEA